MAHSKLGQKAQAQQAFRMAAELDPRYAEWLVKEEADRAEDEDVEGKLEHRLPLR
jgi:DNA-directed RNA polymerase